MKLIINLDITKKIVVKSFELAKIDIYPSDFLQVLHTSIVPIRNKLVEVEGQWKRDEISKEDFEKQRDSLLEKQREEYDKIHALSPEEIEYELFAPYEGTVFPYSFQDIKKFIPQATALVLEEEKIKKLAELNTIYASPDIWNMTISDTKNGVKYALTRSQEWFIQQTPLLTIGLIDNKGNPYFRNLNSEKEALIMKTNISLFGMQMQAKKFEIAKKIEGINTLEKLYALDIQKEFPVLEATVDELIVLKS